jgi:hypothetical protein
MENAGLLTKGARHLAGAGHWSSPHFEGLSPSGLVWPELGSRACDRIMDTGFGLMPETVLYYLIDASQQAAEAATLRDIQLGIVLGPRIRPSGSRGDRDVQLGIVLGPRIRPSGSRSDRDVRLGVVSRDVQLGIVPGQCIRASGRDRDTRDVQLGVVPGQRIRASGGDRDDRDVQLGVVPGQRIRAAEAVTTGTFNWA